MAKLVNLLKKFKFIDMDSEEKPKHTPLEDLVGQTTFITQKLLLLPFPSQDSIIALSAYMKSRFPNHFMIWNLSEHTYDVTFFDGQVLDNIFVGYPNPPLETIFAILNSIKAWLETDQGNIAALHCQASRSRSLMIAACYLAWSGKEFSSPHSALQRLCSQLKLAQDTLMFPSQMRYLDYVDRVMNGAEPVLRRVKLVRVILNGIPRMEADGRGWVRPYLQIFKDSKLIYTSSKESLECYDSEELSVCFTVDTVVDGDIVVRCRHLTSRNSRETIFRLMFHTSFIENHVLHYSKRDLDVACLDSRFPEEFSTDLIFSPEEEEVKSDKQFWKSLHQKHKGYTVPILHDSSEEEEEKIDTELIAKYETKMGESSEDEDNMDDYLDQLENRHCY